MNEKVWIDLLFLSELALLGKLLCPFVPDMLSWHLKNTLATIITAANGDKEQTRNYDCFFHLSNGSSTAAGNMKKNPVVTSKASLLLSAAQTRESVVLILDCCLYVALIGEGAQKQLMSKHSMTVKHH